MPPPRCAVTESAKPQAIGLSHIALEVGDIEEALAFYRRLFEFKLRGKSDRMASLISVTSSLPFKRGASRL
jgi:catechol 2,3-dioxygenase-like lactoylglutathione lyase family enzyme